jgi:hypothetical protein
LAGELHGERAGRQQDRSLEAAEEQHRGDVLTVDANPEMQAGLGTVPWLDLPDHLPARHDVANVEGREHGLVTRDHIIGMPNRQDIAVDHEPREVHDAIRRGQHIAIRRDVDAAMPGRVFRRWRDERPQDAVISAHRPAPPRLLRPCDARHRGHLRDRNRGRDPHRHRDGHRDRQEEQGQRDSKHPTILRNTRSRGPVDWRSAEKSTESRTVGERCYSFGSIPSNGDDYACPLLPQ